MRRFPSYGVRTYLGPPVLNANGLPRLPGVIDKSLGDLWAPEKSGTQRIVHLSALTVGTGTALPNRADPCSDPATACDWAKGLSPGNPF